MNRNELQMIHYLIRVVLLCTGNWNAFEFSKRSWACINLWWTGMDVQGDQKNLSAPDDCIAIIRCTQTFWSPCTTNKLGSEAVTWRCESGSLAYSINCGPHHHRTSHPCQVRYIRPLFFLCTVFWEMTWKLCAVRSEARFVTYTWRKFCCILYAWNSTWEIQFSICIAVLKWNKQVASITTDNIRWAIVLAI